MKSNSILLLATCLILFVEIESRVMSETVIEKRLAQLPSSSLIQIVEAIVSDREFLALPNHQQIQVLMTIYNMLEGFLETRSSNHNGNGENEKNEYKESTPKTRLDSEHMTQ